MSDTNILVTGGAGYIGSQTCKALKENGFSPVAYDSLVQGFKGHVLWGPLIEGDLNDRAKLDKVIKEYRPAGVVHFAAFALVGESVTNPGKYYRNNVVGSLSLLEALRDHGVPSLIFSSTCAVYGVPNQIPIPESHPLSPINPYGTTKLFMERMMADFSAAHNLNFVALRYFNAAGADPDGLVGERHDPETHLIPLVLDAALGLRPNLTVFGTDYETQDGTCIRDYIHVADLADAHVLALRYLQNGGKEHFFNLGNGSGHSVKQVIQTVEKITGKKVPVVYGDRRPGDSPALVGNALKAKNILKWNPQYGKIETIVQHAWNHRMKVRHLLTK